MKNQIIEIYTDGSCHTQYKIGAWAALIFINDKKISLYDTANKTTHNRMELIAVIKALEFVQKEDHVSSDIIIYTDSQYVERIPVRIKKFLANNFKTKKGTLIQNIDLVQRLIDLLEIIPVQFIKVKAHQKASVLPNYNREGDKLSRKLVRTELKNIINNNPNA